MEEIKPIIKVDTGESQKTVKSLKKEISDLRDHILNLTKGTDEYNEAVEQLQANQRELDETMALTKKTATALDGSYDALTHRMSLLKKEWRATADATKRAQIGEEIAKINQELKDMDAEIGNYQRNVGNYVSHWEGAPDAFAAVKAEIKALKTELLSLEEGTEEYNEALTKLGNAQFQLKDMTESAKYATADLGEQLDNVTQIGAGLAAGFSAVQAAMVLMGKDGEDLQKIMVKLQAAMALVQGLKGLEGLGKQIKGLSIALKAATGISLGWVAAIAAVVAALTTLFKNLPSVKSQQEAWNRQIEESIQKQEEFKTSIENANTALEKRIELLQAQGVSEKETLQMQIDQAKANKDAAWDKLMKAQNKYIFDVKSDAQGVMEMTDGAFKQKYGMNKEDALAHYKKLMDDATDFYHQQEAIYNDYLHQMEVLNEKEKTAFKNRVAAMEEALKEEETKLREQYERDLAQAEQYGLDTAVITKKYEADLKALREKNKKAIDGVVDEATLLAEAQKVIDATLDEDIKALDDVDVDLGEEPKTVGYVYSEGDAEKRADIRIAQEERIADRLIELNNMTEQSEEERAAKEFQIRQDLEQKKLDLLKQFKEEANKNGDILGSIELAQEIADQEIAIEKAKYEEKLRLAEYYTNQVNQTISAAANVSQSILEITQAAAEKDGEITEKESKRIKGMQIAIATMNMLAGITAALSGAFTTKTGPWDLALGIAQAATIAASGTANIMKIKNTDLTGNVPSGAMGAVTPNSNIFGTDIPFSYVRNVTSASETDALNQDNRVYILESDIQASNKKVSVRESESSF